MSSKRLVVLDEEDYKDLVERVKRPCLDQNEKDQQVTKISTEPERLEEEIREKTPEPIEEETVLPPEPESEEPSTTEELNAPAVPEASDGPDVSSGPAGSHGPDGPASPSGEQKLLATLPKSAQKSAKGLLDKLNELDSFDFNLETGTITLNGEQLKNYNLEKLLAATCKKSAPNTLPVPLRLFLWRNGLRQFRNKTIRLVPKGKWTSLHA